MRTVSLAGKLCVHVIAVGAPTYAVAAGPVTINDGTAIANVPLVAFASPGPLMLTRTRAAAVAGPVTTQAKLPVLGRPSARVWNVLPPSRLSSILAVELAAGRLVDQVIDADAPTKRVAPAVGFVTATSGRPA